MNKTKLLPDRLDPHWAAERRRAACFADGKMFEVSCWRAIFLVACVSDGPNARWLHVLSEASTPRKCCGACLLQECVCARAREQAWAVLTSTCASGAGEQKGVLTPAEFVSAGDLLVDKCPSWSWEAGDPSKVCHACAFVCIYMYLFVTVLYMYVCNMYVCTCTYLYTHTYTYTGVCV